MGKPSGQHCTVSSPIPEEGHDFSDHNFVPGQEGCQARLQSFRVSPGLFSLSESDILHLETKGYENITSLKPDTMGNLGKHISISRWIAIMQIFGELILSFNMD
jgi:hypothetical protein